MLLQLWFDALMIWRRTSLRQWLLGLLMVVLAGLLLHAASGAKTGSGVPVAADAYLQSAGADLKHGEMLYNEMAGHRTPCKNKDVNR